MFSSISDALGLSTTPAGYEGLPTAAPRAPDGIEAVAFLKELKDRFQLHLTSNTHRLQQPILAISETVDSFLIDSIAAANKRFTTVWPAERFGKEFEFEGPEAIDAFIALVSKARELDPRLQKRFDLVVPKKATEGRFWWRYFGHVHALLVRIAPTSDEMLADLLEKLPAARPLAERRYAPASTLLSEEALPRDRVLQFLEYASTVLSDEETLSALGDEAIAIASAEVAAAKAEAAASDAEKAASAKTAQENATHLAELEAALKQAVDAQEYAQAGELQSQIRKLKSTIEAAAAEAPAPAPAPKPTEEELLRSASRLCILYQMELLEHKGIERLWGCQQLHPPHLMKRFIDMNGDVEKEIQEKLQEFISVCQQAPVAAIAKLRQKPSDDVTKRRYAPAAELGTGAELGVPRLLEIVCGLREMLEAPETARAVQASAKAAVEKVAQQEGVSESEEAQKACMDLVCRWQREYLEHAGVQHDKGMRLIWTIPEVHKLEGPGERELLQAFGKLRLAMQATVNSATIEATKPPEVEPEARRFAPAGELQSEGEVSRAKVLRFTREAASLLHSEESLQLLVKAVASGGKSALATISVQWQRQLLEHHGIQMDFGCRALGDVPRRFGTDKEVMTAFREFQVACTTSMQKACQRHMIDQNKPADVAPEARRFKPAAHLQDDGDLSRSKILKFTREAATVLMNDESIRLLARVGRLAPGGPKSQEAMQAMGTLSVQWQRQLLEHHGIQMDFGCRALGETPMRFGSDTEVMTAFETFAQTCMMSVKRACVEALVDK